MRRLPSTWVESTVGECFWEICNGTTAKQNKDGKGLPVSRIETIQNNRFDFNRIQHIEKLPPNATESFRYRLGDIAFSHINSYEHVGKTALYDGTPELFIHGMNLLRLRLGHRHIEPRFAFLFMRTIFFREEVRKRVGHAVNQVSINQKNLVEVPFVVAPLKEQRRIIAKLEKLLDKVDTAQKRLIEIPIILKRFRQSVLAAACSGRLTADWREERDIDEWSSEPLSKIFTMRNGKSLTVASRKEGNIPVYGGNGFMGIHNEMNAEGQVIVIGRVGAQCGNVHYVIGKVWVTDNAISLQAIKKVDSSFYAFFLRSKNLNQMSGGTGQPYVSQEILNSIEAPIVSLEEQQEIVRRVEKLFVLADKIETRYIKAQAQVNKLSQSILAKAFRGELVPQDPNDEPSSILFEKIKALNGLNLKAKGKVKKEKGREKEKSL